MEALKEAHRLAGQHAGIWEAAGRKVLDPEGYLVLEAHSETTARYVAAVHNTFLPLVRAYRMTRRRLADVVSGGPRVRPQDLPVSPQQPDVDGVASAAKEPKQAPGLGRGQPADAVSASDHHAPLGAANRDNVDLPLNSP